MKVFIAASLICLSFSALAQDDLLKELEKNQAPETEYIMVNAIEIEGQAWVEIDAGIDINPAALNLPGVPLAA